MFKEAIGYVEHRNFLGQVTNVDFASKRVTLSDGEGNSLTVEQSEVEIMFEAFEMNGMKIYDKDVLGAVNGKMYQVELHKNGEVTLHNVNDKFEITDSGEQFEPVGTVLTSLASVMELQGNLYELLMAMPKNPEFNVKIVKHFDGSHFTYFYACNNLEVEQIDLIKVLYMGHRLLEEEKYERNTLSYEDYMKLIADGNLKEVTPQELNNYVTGATYNDHSEDELEEDDVELQDFCEEVSEDTYEEDDLDNPWE